MLPRRHVSRLAPPPPPPHPPPPPPPILTPHARTRIIGQARAGYRASKQPAGRRGLGPAGARVCIQTNEKACRPDPFRESADTCGGLTSPFAAPCRSRSGGSRVGKHELGNCEFVRARGGGGLTSGREERARQRRRRWRQGWRGRHGSARRRPRPSCWSPLLGRSMWRNRRPGTRLQVVLGQVVDSSSKRGNIGVRDCSRKLRGKHSLGWCYAG